MKMLKLSALVGATMLVAPSAMAATILIDDFDVFQRVVDDPDGLFPNQSSVGGIGVDAENSILGGARELEVEVNPSPSTGSVTLTSTSVVGSGPAGTTFTPSQVLRFNVQDGRGTATVTYGIAAGGSSLGDLTDNETNNKFLFDGIVGDLAGTALTSSITTGGGDVFSFLEPLSPNPSATTSFFDFSLDGLGVTFATLNDFKDVASLSFTFLGPEDDPNTPNAENTFDGRISSLSVVPLPASILFLLGGLGGLAGVSAAAKRRRKA